MGIEGSRLQQAAQDRREKLEDRYGKIAIPALAAAVGAGHKEKDQRQMSAEAAYTRLQQMAQS